MGTLGRMRDRAVQGIGRGKSLPLGSPHPSRLRRATFPQGGKAWMVQMQRPQQPPRERAEARKQGNSDPLAESAGTAPENTVQTPHNRPKGVLRTLVLSGLLVTFLPREKSPAGGRTRYRNTISRLGKNSTRQNLTGVSDHPITPADSQRISYNAHKSALFFPP